ncbi:MAG: insulinase family protein [Acidobacteria bacterium]|nr:MAG: insulinase family protein [Acidobacteriota bacterium]
MSSPPVLNHMPLKLNLKCGRERLDNGLVLLISENHKVPLVSLNAFVLAGQDQNPPDKPGLAAFTARMLDEGTENYDYSQMADVLEGAGGALSIFSQRELSGINLQLKAEDLELGFDLLAEMLCRPVFPADRLELEKEKVQNHLRSMEDDPPTVAGNLFNRLIYGGTPLQHPALGLLDSVDQLSVSDLRLFHSQRYSPLSTLIVLAGDISPEAARESVKTRFAGWKTPEYEHLRLTDLKRQDAPIFETTTVDKEQVHILLGHLGVTRRNPDFPVLQVLDVILGSGPGFTSRIPRRLRDEQGLAYTTYSDISGSAGIYPGRFAAYICTSPENRETALKGLVGEIRELVENGITQEELETAQDYLTGSFVFEVQSNAMVARFLLSVELFDLGMDYLDRYPSIIRSVTREDVERVARLYLDTVNYTTVIVGPSYPGTLLSESS